MSKHRLRFSKTGKARYISHLDLVRTFQRAFQRSGVKIRHTSGFNPHAFVSMLLPLALGVESECELMDFGLVGDRKPERVPELLNPCLPAGICVQKVYEGGRKASELAFASFEAVLKYDGGVPDGAAERIRELFSGDTLMVVKETKRGKSEFNLISHLKNLEIIPGEREVRLRFALPVQNPSLPPDCVVKTISDGLPELEPDFASYRRTEVFDAELRPFE